MACYRNSVVYEIICNQTGERYVGSTKRPLKDRMTQHRREMRYSSKQIIERGDYTENILETYPCKDKDELRKREQYWMDKLECINKHRAWRLNNRKEWKEENKEYVKEYHKQKYLNNRDHHLALGKIWTENNRDYKKKYHKKLYDYKCSWGEKAWGHPDDTNLLKIDPRLFT